MRQTITKNDKNIKVINRLIESGVYNGYIDTEKFELTPNHFPNNHRILGILDDSGNYELRFDLKSSMKIAGNCLIGFGILISISSLIDGSWILPITFIVIGFIYFIIF